MGWLRCWSLAARVAAGPTSVSARRAASISTAGSKLFRAKAVAEKSAVRENHSSHSGNDQAETDSHGKISQETHLSNHRKPDSSPQGLEFRTPVQGIPNRKRN